jgi:hypothetical protein
VTAEKLFFHIFFQNFKKSYLAAKKFKKSYLAAKKFKKSKIIFFCQFYIPINPESAKNRIKNGQVRIKDQLFDFSLHEMIT